MSLRVRCRGPIPPLALAQADIAATGDARKGSRPAWFGERFEDTPVYDRYALAAGATLQGPAIIEEREATTIVAPATA